MEQEKIGKKIRSLRTSEGLTLEQLSAILHIKKNMLSNYELGKTVISTEILTKIADYFNISLDYLTQRGISTLKESNIDDTYITVPVYSHLYDENPDSETNQNQHLYNVTLPQIFFPEGSYFGLILTDNSLDLKSYYKGSAVIAKKQSVARTGDLIIYIYKDEPAKYGVYSFTGESIIISPASTNSSFMPNVYKLDDNEFKIIGKIIFHMGAVKNDKNKTEL